MSHLVTLNSEILHRYICELTLSNTKKILGISRTTKVQCIIDTACVNTLIPLRFAKVCGTTLNKKAEVTVGAQSYQATAYKFENVSLGRLRISKMIAFAGE